MVKVLAAKCSGCKICQLICSVQHFSVYNPAKSALAITGDNSSLSYTPVVCTQCGLCAEVCPEEAIDLREGVYVIKPERCTLCGMCMDECPDGVMFKHADVSWIIKCDDCGRCIDICPTQALTN